MWEGQRAMDETTERTNNQLLYCRSERFRRAQDANSGDKMIKTIVFHSAGVVIRREERGKKEESFNGEDRCFCPEWEWQRRRRCPRNSSVRRWPRGLCSLRIDTRFSRCSWCYGMFWMQLLCVSPSCCSLRERYRPWVSPICICHHRVQQAGCQVAAATLSLSATAFQ